MSDAFLHVKVIPHHHSSKQQQQQQQPLFPRVQTQQLSANHQDHDSHHDHQHDHGHVYDLNDSSLEELNDLSLELVGESLEPGVSLAEARQTIWKLLDPTLENSQSESGNDKSKSIDNVDEMDLEQLQNLLQEFGIDNKKDGGSDLPNDLEKARDYVWDCITELQQGDGDL